MLTTTVPQPRSIAIVWASASSNGARLASGDVSRSSAMRDGTSLAVPLPWKIIAAELSQRGLPVDPRQCPVLVGKSPLSLDIAAWRRAAYPSKGLSLEQLLEALCVVERPDEGEIRPVRADDLLPPPMHVLRRDGVDRRHHLFRLGHAALENLAAQPEEQ